MTGFPTDERALIEYRWRGCACGRPLHYAEQSTLEAMVRLVEEHGECIRMVDSRGRAFMVQRHYVALHGMRETQLARIADELGFEEVSLDG